MRCSWRRPCDVVAVGCSSQSIHMFQIFEFNMNIWIYKHFCHSHSETSLNLNIPEVWSMEVWSVETGSNQLIHARQQKLKRLSSGCSSPISSIPAPCPLSDTVLQFHCKQAQRSCWECAISRKTCKAQGWERTCSRPSDQLQTKPVSWETSSWLIHHRRQLIL